MRKQEGVGYPCGNYSYSISDEESLKEIQGTERNENYGSCAQCGYITNCKNNLVSHLQTHHRESEHEKQTHHRKSGEEKHTHLGESGGEMQHETNWKEVNNLRSERSVQTKIVHRKSERSGQRSLFRKQSYSNRSQIKF